MNLLRSLLFLPLFYGWTALMVIGCLPTLLGPWRWALKAQEGWAGGVMFLTRTVLRIRYEVRGRENMPKGCALFAVKHQSAWETVSFHHILAEPAIVMKKELLSIPLYGWYSRRIGMIPIDRKGGAGAMRRMLRTAESAKNQGRPILIFPEGTRRPVGADPAYLPGVAGLYRHLDVPLVPVALNSGLFWPRRALIKRAGRITVQILPPIEPGLERAKAMQVLETRIETATGELIRNPAP